MRWLARIGQGEGPGLECACVFEERQGSEHGWSKDSKGICIASDEVSVVRETGFHRPRKAFARIGAFTPNKSH